MPATKLNSAQSDLMRDLQQKVREMSLTNIWEMGEDIPALLTARRAAIEVVIEKLRREFPDAANVAQQYSMGLHVPGSANLSPLEMELSQLFHHALSLNVSEVTPFELAGRLNDIETAIHEVCAFSDEYSEVECCWKNEIEDENDEVQ